MDITDSGVEALCEALVMGREGCLEGVSVINLSNNKITDASVDQLLNCVEECTNISSINLQDNNFTNQDVMI